MDADAQAVDAFASDYVPTSLVEAAFLCAREGRASLPEAIRMLTSRPAEVFGITDRGRLAAVFFRFWLRRHPAIFDAAVVMSDSVGEQAARVAGFLPAAVTTIPNPPLHGDAARGDGNQRGTHRQAWAHRDWLAAPFPAREPDQYSSLSRRTADRID